MDFYSLESRPSISYTVPLSSGELHSLYGSNMDKKMSLVVKSWLLAPSLTDRDRLLPHL